MIQDSRSQRGRGIKRVFSKRIQINDEAQEVMLYDTLRFPLPLSKT